MNGPADTPHVSSPVAPQATAATPSRADLITFPPSLDCELARFVLTYYGIPFTDHRHTVYFSFIFSWWHGNTLQVPLLYGSVKPPIDTLRKIIDHFDPLCPDDRNLLLSGADRARVEADWSQFNALLGGATAAFAYFNLLPLREAMLRPLTEGTPYHEVLAVRWFYPAFAFAVTRLLALSPARAQEAIGQIRDVVLAVDARLADGRRYLVGNRLSLSDLSFANAMAPMVLPEEYAGPLPKLAEMPPVLQAAVAEMRSHPAGQFALRIYRDSRGAPGKTAAE